jgi:hypothetical protein
VPAHPSVVPATAAAPNQAGDFSRTAKAILVTMVLLIVALTGVLVETTWRNPDGGVEVPPSVSDPGSFARR